MKDSIPIAVVSVRTRNALQGWSGESIRQAIEELLEEEGIPDSLDESVFYRDGYAFILCVPGAGKDIIIARNTNMEPILLNGSTPAFVVMSGDWPLDHVDKSAMFAASGTENGVITQTVNFADRLISKLGAKTGHMVERGPQDL